MINYFTEYKFLYKYLLDKSPGIVDYVPTISIPNQKILFPGFGLLPDSRFIYNAQNKLIGILLTVARLDSNALLFLNLSKDIRKRFSFIATEMPINSIVRVNLHIHIPNYIREECVLDVIQYVMIWLYKNFTGNRTLN